MIPKNSSLVNVPIEKLPLVGPSYAKRLKKLGIETVWDLFHYVPTRFLDFSKNSPIRELKMDEIATIRGTVSSFINTYTKTGKTMQIVAISDGTGRVEAIWFNQIYLSSVFREGTEVSLAGKLTWIGRKRAIVAPEYEIIKEDEEQIHTGHLVSTYAETAGVTSKWLRRRIHDAWKRYGNDVEEFLPTEILTKYKLVGFKEAIEGVHFPKSMEEFEKAKRRLAFNELLTLHSANIKRKRKWLNNKIKNKFGSLSTTEFIKTLPFSLTEAQNKVNEEILLDLAKDTPMNRLLEGDVGSGKTIVAATAMYISLVNKKRSVILAPTQILANQHFETLGKLFKPFTKVGLITSTAKINIDAPILVGTHALLNKKFDIPDLGLVVIDEQHKFGVEQRNAIVGKGIAPHILTMTATPIPRTVALTFFGDTDLSTIDEMPKGRQKITTWVIPEIKREKGFEWIESQIQKEKIQAYVVCPLIDESENETMLEVKAANNEYLKLKKQFPKLRIGLMHGKLKSKEKDEIVEKFKEGTIDILVSTPVVEVGVDIPNATIMVIEAADRFGLASLHQLRGRVGRGSKKSYCLLMTESTTEKTQERLNAMTQNLTGFQLAELDLRMRGPGEIFGKKQSGIPELKIADWSDIELIKDTREVAELLTR